MRGCFDWPLSGPERAPKRIDGRQVCHITPLRLHDVRKESPRAEDDAFEGNIEHLVELGLGHHQEAAAGRDSGVVDEHINFFTVSGHNFTAEPLNTIFIRDIADVNGDIFRSRVLQQAKTPGLLQLGKAYITERKTAAFAAQLASKFSTHAA